MNPTPQSVTESVAIRHRSVTDSANRCIFCPENTESVTNPSRGVCDGFEKMEVIENIENIYLFSIYSLIRHTTPRALRVCAGGGVGVTDCRSHLFSENRYAKRSAYLSTVERYDADGAGSHHVGAGSNISSPAEQRYDHAPARRRGAECQTGQDLQAFRGSFLGIRAADRGGNGSERPFCLLQARALLHPVPEMTCKTTCN